jgi:hypothetical protein
MRVIRWIQSKWLKSKINANQTGFASSQNKRRFQPQAELLEDRFAPALFGPAITQGTGGNRPVAVWVADFNGDGRPDIAVANFSSGTLSVGLGNGDGTFAQAFGSPFAVGGSANAVTAADFNGDGFQDIAVADASDSRVDYFFGSAFIGSRGLFNLPSMPLCMQAADFNHDGFADVAVGQQNGDVQVIFGASTFAGFHRSFVASGTGAVTALATGDYNNDGNGDIAVVRETGSSTTLSIYFGNGMGAFSPGPFITMSATRATSMVAGDFQGTGRLDLAIANFTNNTITVVLSNGGGTFQTPMVIPVLGNPFSLVAADFNRDGRVDLIKSNNANNSITPMIGNGNGTFVLTPTFNVGTSPEGMAVGDFNNDGRPDLVVVNSTTPGSESVLLNTSLGIHFNVSAPSGASTGASFPVTVTAADISNATVTGYRGSVHFTSSDGSASLPADYTFTLADNGSHTFSVTLNTAGNQTIVVTDKSDATIRGFTSVTVSNPAPSITMLSPTTAVEGSGGFSLIVTGSGFIPSSVVKWNGTSLATTFINSMQLSAAVPSSKVADEGTNEVTVVNPPPGGGTAGPIDFIVTDAPLTLTGGSVTGTEGISGSFQVASLVDANPIAPATDFTSGAGSILIDWGDGMTSSGTVLQPGGVGTTFFVQGTHTYAQEGSHTISVTVTDVGLMMASTTTSVTINDAPLSLSTNPIKVMAGMTFNGQVATFSDANPSAPLSDFTATIDWGDSTGTTPGMISQTGTTFVVMGSHVYATNDTHIFRVTVNDVGGSSATGTGLAGKFLVHDIAGRASQTGQWWVSLSNGTNAFNSALLWTTWNPALPWVDVVTGDFNGDGKTDIAGRVQNSGQWWVALSTGTSFTTTLWTTWNPAINWVDVKVGDFDGATNLTTGLPIMDIAGRDLATGNWWVAKSTGGASFTNTVWTTWNPGINWVDVNVGDFTGDGKADIAGRDLAAGNWWVAQSTGASFTTSLWATWNTAFTWVNVNVGDFNGDKKADIVGRALQTGQLWVGLSTSTSFNTTLWGAWTTAFTWVDVKIGDFNGDGSSDIIGREQQTGLWWVAYSNGTSAFSNVLFASWDPTVHWVDAQVGDFNADGRDDITARDQATGNWSTSLSNGTTGMTSLWTTWNTAFTWVDVHSGVFV